MMQPQQQTQLLPIFTAPILEGLKIVEYKGLVTARNVRAVNAVRDFFTSFRDIFGGRSDSYQEVMTDMEREVFTEISMQARALGANAVIGVGLDFENESAWTNDRRGCGPHCDLGHTGKRGKSSASSNYCKI